MKLVPIVRKRLKYRFNQLLKGLWKWRVNFATRQSKGALSYINKLKTVQTLSANCSVWCWMCGNNLFQSGAHNPERAASMRSCHGVFTDQFIAFVGTHPNLVLLWYKGRNFRAITGDCRLAASINFIRAHLGSRKLDSFGRAGVGLVFVI